MDGTHWDVKTLAHKRILSDKRRATNSVQLNQLNWNKLKACPARDNHSAECARFYGRLLLFSRALAESLFCFVTLKLPWKVQQRRTKLHTVCIKARALFAGNWLVRGVKCPIILKGDICSEKCISWEKLREIMFLRKTVSHVLMLSAFSKTISSISWNSTKWCLKWG